MDDMIIPNYPPDEDAKPLDYVAVFDELIRSQIGEKYFWKACYEHLEPNYNIFHGMLFRERKRREREIEIVLIPPPMPVSYYRPATLDELNDSDRWTADLQALLHSKRYVWVMHAADLHEPYSDEAAKESLFQLARIIQPDIIIRGSDEEDNPNISVFAERDGDAPDIGDFLDLMQETRHYNTRRFMEVVPNALQVNIEGNHGFPRMKRWINKNANQSRASLTRRYVENIRVQGDVAFIGFKESVKIHPALLVMHGKKWGDYAPKQTLALRAMGINIMAGHSHKPGYFTTVQADGRSVACLISGCLCNLNPHYAPEDDDAYTTWQHSTGVALLDTVTGIVDLQNVIYHHDNKDTWFVWGDKIYRYPNGHGPMGMSVDDRKAA